MANPNKGEVGFKADGKDYRLRFSADAICNLEDELNLTVNQIGKLMQDPETLRMSMVRTAFCVGLRDAHPEIDADGARAVFKTLKLMTAITLVSKSFSLAFTDDESEGKAENPPKPGPDKSGTGPAS